MNATTNDALLAAQPEQARPIIKTVTNISGVSLAAIRSKQVEAMRARRVLIILLRALTDLADEDIALIVGSTKPAVGWMASWFVRAYEREPQRMMRHVGLLFPASIMLGADILDVIRANS